MRASRALFVVSWVGSLGACATTIKTPTKQTPVTTTSTPLVAPAVPAPTATAGDTTVTLAWDAPATATSYTITRALDGKSFAPLATTSAATYVDKALSNGRLYSYEVQAIGPGGDSAFSAPVAATPSAAFDRWTMRHHSATLAQVAYGAQTFVAVGHGGTVRYSTNDGASWADATTHVSADLTRVTYDAARGFIAISSETVITSPDGVSWTARGPVHTDKIPLVAPNGLACNSAICVVTAVNTAFTSSDLTTWTSSALPLRATDIAATGNGFVVGGATSSGAAIAFSADGLVWALPYSDTSAGVTAVLSGSAGFTAFTSTNSGFSVIGSGDGVSWSIIGNSSCASGGVSAAVLTATQLFAVCDSLGAAHVANDTSGTVWTAPSLALPIASFFHGAAFGATHIAIVGDAGAIVTVAGATASSVVSEGNLTSLAHGAGLFVAVGSNAVIYTSVDTTVWAAHSAPMRDPLERVAFGAGQFWTVGDEKIFSATDGVTWAPESTPLLFGRLHGVAVADDGTSATNATNATIVALGDYGATSATFAVRSGGKWSTYVGPELPALSDVAWGNGTFVAVGASGSILTSATGASASGWAAHSSAVTTDFVRVLWNGKVFVALSRDGIVITSPDGSTWAASDVPEGGSYSALGSDGTTTFVGGSNALLAQSVHDAWPQRFPGTPSKSDTLTDLLFANGAWVFVGRDALIMTKP